MDLGTLVGLIGGVACIIISAVSSGSSIDAFVDIPSVFMTIGGSWSALMINYSLKDAIRVFSIIGRTFRVQDYGGRALVEKLFELADRARREGILSLEEYINELDDRFLQQGLKLVVDGTDAEIIRTIMETELNQMNERHSKWIKMLDAWSKLAPGFGMLGTVMGLIGMMRNLEDKSRIGPNMAVALITTFYGAIMANFLFTPLMGKLAGQDHDETLIKEMCIEGVLSIQAGDNPRILLVKLASYLNPADKSAVIDKFGKD